MQKQFAMIQAVLGGIGAVSLLVAAIGIANTMMMSIYERTKEIGVIKVLGCSLKNIRQMFLLEAGFIGLIGGVIGNILSLMMSFVVNKVVGSMGAEMGMTDVISYIPPWLCADFTCICDSCGNGGRILPGTTSNEIKSACSNSK